MSTRKNFLLSVLERSTNKNGFETPLTIGHMRNIVRMAIKEADQYAADNAAAKAKADQHQADTRIELAEAKDLLRRANDRVASYKRQLYGNVYGHVAAVSEITGPNDKTKVFAMDTETSPWGWLKPGPAKVMHIDRTDDGRVKVEFEIANGVRITKNLASVNEAFTMKDKLNAVGWMSQYQQQPVAKEQEVPTVEDLFTYHTFEAMYYNDRCNELEDLDERVAYGKPNTTDATWALRWSEYDLCRAQLKKHADKADKLYDLCK
jgi:hypothetical protein